MNALTFLYLFFATNLILVAIEPSLWVGFIMISTLVTISIVERRVEE